MPLVAHRPVRPPEQCAARVHPIDVERSREAAEVGGVRAREVTRLGEFDVLCARARALGTTLTDDERAGVRERAPAHLRHHRDGVFELLEGNLSLAPRLHLAEDEIHLDGVERAAVLQARLATKLSPLGAVHGVLADAADAVVAVREEGVVQRLEGTDVGGPRTATGGSPRGRRGISGGTRRRRRERVGDVVAVVSAGGVERNRR